MRYELRITDAAAHDLLEIYNWIAANDAPGKADHVIGQIAAGIESIASLPHRGAKPEELSPSIEGEFRQIFFKPYRIIYEITGQIVLVHLIADGRRNLQSLLARRLTRR